MAGSFRHKVSCEFMLLPVTVVSSEVSVGRDVFQAFSLWMVGFSFSRLSDRRSLYPPPQLFAEGPLVPHHTGLCGGQLRE